MVYILNIQAWRIFNLSAGFIFVFTIFLFDGIFMSFRIKLLIATIGALWVGYGVILRFFTVDDSDSKLNYNPFGTTFGEYSNILISNKLQYHVKSVTHRVNQNLAESGNWNNLPKKKENKKNFSSRTSIALICSFRIQQICGFKACVFLLCVDFVFFITFFVKWWQTTRSVCLSDFFFVFLRIIRYHVDEITWTMHEHFLIIIYCSIFPFNSS